MLTYIPTDRPTDQHLKMKSSDGAKNLIFTLKCTLECTLRLILKIKSSVTIFYLLSQCLNFLKYFYFESTPNGKSFIASCNFWAVNLGLYIIIFGAISSPDLICPIDGLSCSISCSTDQNIGHPGPKNQGRYCNS